MKQRLHPVDLDSVRGGQNTTQIQTAYGSYKSNSTDYKACLDTATKVCDAKNRTSVLGFDTGPNSKKSAQCLEKALPAMCGKPGS